MKCNESISRISLDGKWKFSYTQELGFMEDETPHLPVGLDYQAEMPVPGHWDDHIEALKRASFWSQARFNTKLNPIQFPTHAEFPSDGALPFLLGVGWYQRSFGVPREVESKSFALHIGGVRLEAWIWINGAFVAHHLGHSTPFDVEITKCLKAGRNNEIVIAVSNTRSDRLGCDLRGYKGFSGGIYRPVYIKVAGQARISDLYLRPSTIDGQIIWNVELEGNTQGLTLDWVIKDRKAYDELAKGNVAIKEKTLDFVTENCKLKPWSDRDPNLYLVEVRLRRDRTVLDRLEQSFGTRLLQREGRALRLNGKPVMLRGGTDHCYFPLSCTPPPDIDIYRNNILRMKEIGFNWIRFHTWVPSEEYMHAADELGMLIQVEPPVGYTELEWIHILRTCRKHPSVVIYCCGNEELLDESKIRVLERSSVLCRELAPDALFNPQEALRGIEYGWSLSDMGEPEDVTETPFRHNKSRLDKISNFSDVLGHYSWGYLSYVSSHGDWRGLDERMSVYELPCLAHEIGIHSSYLDPSLEQRYESTRIGTDLYVAFREYVNSMGLKDKVLLYYEHSCAWMQLLRKHALETLRKCKGFAGYDLLGATDQHWACACYSGGVMNEFYELKAGISAEDVLKFNGESVLLLDCDNNRNLNDLRTYRFNVMASLFGPSPFMGGYLEWVIKDTKQRIYADSRMQLGPLPWGEVADLGTIKFAVPELSEPAELTVYLALKGRDYNIQNEWKFWAFPEVSLPLAPAAADPAIIETHGHHNGSMVPLESDSDNRLKIVTSIDQNTLRWLENGDRIVLLGDGPFPSLPTAFQMALAGRAGGNMATVIADHPLMHSFPHEGLCDWQFYSMLEGGTAVVFNDLDIPFDPIIDIASSFKLIYFQSPLFELAVEKGKLLVCTLNLDPRDVSAKYLLDRILIYSQSEEFAPRNSITTKDLLRIMNSKYGPYGVKDTDMAYDPKAQL